MKSFILLFFLFFARVECVVHLHNIVLEPIYRFTDTSANPTKQIYFTKLSQFSSVTQNSALLNITQFGAVRGLTQEMFLKDLGCGADTCQGLPIKLTPVFNVIDSQGRLKFEVNPSGNVLGKAGYLATEQFVGLVRYDEYYSEKDGLFAYVNGKYPNQFGACQLRDSKEYRYKFVRTLGYAFTPITIPENLPIYSIFGFDDGLPDPTTSTASPTTTSLKTSTQVTFTTNPIWVILKNATNGVEGLGAVNLPWTPPASATPIQKTNICLLNGNFSLLSKCGAADRVLQFFDDTHTYIGFIDMVADVENTFIYSYIGFAFRSAENLCGLPLVPMRELYKNGVGYTGVAGDDYQDLISSGYSLTGRILGYSIDCASAPNGQIIADIPDDVLLSTLPATLPTSSSPSQRVGFYVEPVVIVHPQGADKLQGYWFGNYYVPGYDWSETNICVFPANATSLPECGYASTLYLYDDLTDNFYFVGTQSFGRNVSSRPVGIAFQSAENACGLNLVPIREFFKEGTGYYAIAGDDTSAVLADGYTATGNIMGYTVSCDDREGSMVYGHLPTYELSTAASGGTTTPDNSSDVVWIYVSAAYNVTATDQFGMDGYWWADEPDPFKYNPYERANALPICLFTANQTFLPQCGSTSPLYQFFDSWRKYLFFAPNKMGRVNSTSIGLIGLVFDSAENTCGLKLEPMRELYKEGVGYTVVAGNDYGDLVSQGYNLTGNIMGYTVRCPNATDKMVCAHLPTPPTTTSTVPETTTKPGDPVLDCNTISGYEDLRTKMINFSRPMEVGDKFTMRGVIDKNANMSYVNLYPGYGVFTVSPVSLHVRVQYLRNSIIYNSYLNGRWGAEVFGTQPYVSGTPYTISIIKNTTSYDIYNGPTLIFRFFIRNALNWQIGSWIGYGDWSVLSVSMDCARTTTVSTTPESTTTTSSPSPSTTTPIVSTSSPTSTSTTTEPPTTTELEHPYVDCNTLSGVGDLRTKMINFSRPMEVGDKFTMTGVIDKNANMSFVNLYPGYGVFTVSPVSLHVRVQYLRKSILYNSYLNRNWGAEVFGTQPYVSGTPYTISIIKNTTSYDIYNGPTLIFKFTIRNALNWEIGSWIGYGDWSVLSVSMDCARTTTVSTTTESTTSESTTSEPTTSEPTTSEPTTTSTPPSTSTSTSAATTPTSSSTSTTTTVLPTTTELEHPYVDCNTLSGVGDLRTKMINFSRPMEVGDKFTMTGVIDKNANMSFVNLYPGYGVFTVSPVSLHVRVQYLRKSILYNSYLNRNWGAEVFGTQPYVSGTPYTISIIKNTTSYDIYNGPTLIFKFTIRNALNWEIGSWIGYGDWSVLSVSMDCARTTTVSTTTESTTTESTTTTTTTTSTTMTSTTTEPKGTVSYGACDPNSISLGKGDSNMPQIMVDVNFSNYATSGTASSVKISCTALPNYNVYMQFNENQGGPSGNEQMPQSLSVELTCSESQKTWEYSQVVNGVTYSRTINSVTCQQAANAG